MLHVLVTDRGRYVRVMEDSIFSEYTLTPTYDILLAQHFVSVETAQKFAQAANEGTTYIDNHQLDWSILNHLTGKEIITGYESFEIVVSKQNTNAFVKERAGEK